MKLNKQDVAHIASFKEGAFKDWKAIINEVKAYRLESSVLAIQRADKALGLTFE